MRDEVVIAGSGVAACCCASLLQAKGHRVWGERDGRVASPVLMLSDQTQLLLRDVFGNSELFSDAVPVRKRIVLWGEGREAVTLPHSGLVMRESALLKNLWPTISLQTGHPDGWRVVAEKKSMREVTQYEFGSRFAWAYNGTLKSSADEASCWVESVKDGWLFLVPGGSLLSVGQEAQRLLAESRLVSVQIESVGEAVGRFPAYPRIVGPLGGPRWIAAGTAAIGFDPIAGEGAGNAVREGILAAALIRSAMAGENADDLLAHYSNRLLSGFSRHLQECSRYYEAMTGEWWQEELNSIRQGIAWTQQQLAAQPRPLFRLTGFDLQRVVPI